MVNPDKRIRFRRSLLRWGSSSRRDFVWRRRLDPEFVLICEMLLRKTRADAAERVVLQLFDEYPDLEALAGAGETDLSKILRPIGLNRIRAKAVKAVSTELVQRHGARVPRDLDELLSLPHVGRYAANAVLCFAFKERRPIVDANVVRVFERVFGTGAPVEVHKADHLWDFAASMVPEGCPEDFNYALLDLGALICKPGRPLCHSCPVSDMCDAYREGEVEPRSN